MSWAFTERGYAQRRVCDLVGIDPRVYRYRSTRPDDTELRLRLKEVALERRRFRVLCVIDDVSRECLVTVVDNSISGERVARELDAIAELG